MFWLFRWVFNFVWFLHFGISAFGFFFWGFVKFSTVVFFVSFGRVSSVFVSFGCGSFCSIFLVVWLLMASFLIPISSSTESVRWVLTDMLATLSSETSMNSSLGGGSKLATIDAPSSPILMAQQLVALKFATINNLSTTSAKGSSKKSLLVSNAPNSSSVETLSAVGGMHGVFGALKPLNLVRNVVPTQKVASYGAAVVGSACATGCGKSDCSF